MNNSAIIKIIEMTFFLLNQRYVINNIDKTNWMRIALSPKPDQIEVLSIGGQQIEEVAENKYLGIIIDYRPTHCIQLLEKWEKNQLDEFVDSFQNAGVLYKRCSCTTL